MKTYATGQETIEGEPMTVVKARNGDPNRAETHLFIDRTGLVRRMRFQHLLPKAREIAGEVVVQCDPKADPATRFTLSSQELTGLRKVARPRIKLDY